MLIYLPRVFFSAASIGFTVAKAFPYWSFSGDLQTRRFGTCDSDDNLMYLQCCRRTASNLYSSASFRPSGCCSLLVQLFKPIGVKSGQVALTRTAKILVMCTVSGLVDVVMKHFSCMLIAKASFGQVDTKGNTQGSDQSGLSRTVV